MSNENDLIRRGDALGFCGVTKRVGPADEMPRLQRIVYEQACDCIAEYIAALPAAPVGVKLLEWVNDEAAGVDVVYMVHFDGEVWEVMYARPNPEVSQEPFMFGTSETRDGAIALANQKNAETILGWLEAPMQCAECDCDNPPHGCNWIKAVRDDFTL
jgi:hypothetical protein